MKDKLKWVGVIGVLIGIGLSRIIGNYYGANGKIAIFAILVVILVFLILYYTSKKKYLEAIRGCGIVIPLIIGFAGMYLDNLYLLIGGIASMFISIPVIIKVTSKFTNHNTHS